MELNENNILKATHFGIIKIGEKELNCAVLENGSRIINKSTVFKAFGRTKRGRKKDEIRVPSKPNLPSFIDAKNLSEYITNELEEYLKSASKELNLPLDVIKSMFLDLKIKSPTDLSYDRDIKK